MLEKLAGGRRAVGVKQSGKAVRDKRAAAVYLAMDADPALLEPLRRQCLEQQVPLVEGYSMQQLGTACQIAVGAAAAAVLKD